MRPLPVLILVLLAVGATLAAIFLTRGNDARTPAAVTNTQPAVPASPNDDEGRITPAAPTAVRDETPVKPEDVAASTDDEGGPSTNRVFGVVVNDENKPVANASVQLSTDALMGESLAMEWFANREPTGKVLRTETNAKGEYTFRGVDPARSYYVMAVHPDYAAVQEEGIRVQRTGDFRAPELVLRPGSICEGTVSDVEGTPIANATIDLDSAYMMSFNMQSPDRLTAKTDGLGHFELKNVSPGPRIISCSADGFERQIDHSLNFTGEAGEKRTKDFRLGVGYPLAGRVFGPESEGVKGANVIALNYGANVSSRGESLTDDDGNFQIDGLAQGSYILMIEAKGYRAARQNRVQVGDLNLQIEMLKQNTLTGRVFEQASGKPVETFTVQLLHVNTAIPIQGTAQVNYEPTTIKEKISGSSDGTFTLVGVDPGLFAVKVTANGFASRVTDNFQVVDNQAMPPIEVGLSKGGSIRGRVVDSASSQPISGVQVASKDGDMPDGMIDPFMDNLVATRATERKVRTDAEGFFELKLLNPGRYRLQLEHPSYTTEWISDVVVAEGQTADAGSHSMHGGGSVSGKVLDSSGKPATRAVVRMFGADDNQYEARTGADGKYTIEHVKPGLYRLTATRSSGSGGGDAFDQILDQQQSEKQVNVSEGQTINLDLTLGG